MAMLFLKRQMCLFEEGSHQIRDFTLKTTNLKSSASIMVGIYSLLLLCLASFHTLFLSLPDNGFG
jgi:hypothetical protein